MPRNRTARLAVLGSAERRASASSSLARDRKTLRRRLIVVVLVLLSLALLTISFRESSSGPLHRLQGYASQVMRPFQVVADRVAQAVRGRLRLGCTSVLKAKKENKKLRAELKRLQQQRAQQKNAEIRGREAGAILHYERSPRFPDDYDAGQRRGADTRLRPLRADDRDRRRREPEIRVDDPVINEDGLVGRISQVGPTTSKVTLVSDPSFAASARDLLDRREGIVRHPATGSDVLMLDGVKVEQMVQGRRLGRHLGLAAARSAPRSTRAGIPIGSITSYSQTDVNPDKTDPGRSERRLLLARRRHRADPEDQGCERSVRIGAQGGAGRLHRRDPAGELVRRALARARKRRPPARHHRLAGASARLGLRRRARVSRPGSATTSRSTGSSA